MGDFTNFGGREEEHTKELLALEFFDSFAATLVSAYSLNLSNNTYHAFCKELDIRRFWRDSSWEFIHDYIAQCVPVEEQDALSRALDINYMRQRLAETPRYSLEYRDFAQGTMRYLRATIARGRDSEHAAITFTDITAECDYKLKQAKEEYELRTLLHEFQIAQGYGTFRAECDEAGKLLHIQWSNEARSIMGFSETEPISQEAWVSRIHPDDLAIAASANWSLHVKGTSNDSYDIIYRFLVGSTYRYIRNVGRFLRRANGIVQSYIGYFMDVTDEVMVRKQRTQLQAVCDMMAAARWNLTLDTAGNITSIHFSEAFRRYIGYTKPEEFPDDFTFWARQVHPDDYAGVMASFVAATQDPAGEANFDYQYRMRNASGNYNWYRSALTFQRDSEGRPLSGIGVLVNVNDSYVRAEQEEKLHDAYARLKEQMKVIGGLSTEYGSVFLVTDKDRSIRNWSTHGKLVNLEVVANVDNRRDHKEALEYYKNNFIHPDDREYFARMGNYERIQETLDKDGVYKFDFRRFLNGEMRHTQLIHVRPTNSGDTRDFILAQRDTEEEYQAEVKRRKALEDAFLAAEHANRAKTVFLNSMSHDIRTPMNAIVGFTALASAHLNNTELVRDYLSKITVSSKHLLSLINDVLDMSRIESGNVKIETKEVHLPDVFHDLRSIIQGDIAAKNLELFIDTVDVVNEDVICDRLRLNQVLLNLLSNAVKFTPSGGTISIRIIQKPSAKQGWADYDFKVKDTGIGISPEFQKHIFEAFTREKTATVTGIQGTGLGLAITKNIVDMMNGTISVISELGKGSEFTVSVSLPTVGSEAQATPPPQLKDLKVLIADDDLNTCLSVAKMLRLIGMRTEWTTSGKEAVIRTQFAFDEQDEFYAYIIDWLMPDQNGIETVRRIRQIIGDSHPIIILTAYDWSDIEEEARAAGVTDFCAKPLFLSDLKEIFYRPYCEQEVPVEPIAKVQDFTGKKVLLVEDNALNMELAQTILAESGFVVTGATDGDEAVEMLRKATEGQYDVVLMDIQMPKMDGYTATREIRTLTNPYVANIPILAMTANAFEEDKRKAIAAGMNGFITKPIDVEMLLVALGEALS